MEKLKTLSNVYWEKRLNKWDNPIFNYDILVLKNLKNLNRNDFNPVNKGVMGVVICLRYHDERHMVDLSGDLIYAQNNHIRGYNNFYLICPFKSTTSKLAFLSDMRIWTGDNIEYKRDYVKYYMCNPTYST